jgi:hypothetical protein
MYTWHTWLIILVGVLFTMNVLALPVDTSLTEVESTKDEFAELASPEGSMGDDHFDPCQLNGLPIFPTHKRRFIWIS